MTNTQIIRLHEIESYLDKLTTIKNAIVAGTGIKKELFDMACSDKEFKDAILAVVNDTICNYRDELEQL